MKYAAGPSMVMERSVQKSAAHQLCMLLTKNTLRLNFQRREYMKKLLASCCTRAEMGLIKIWSRPHHHEELLVDFLAPLMRRKSGQDSRVSAPTNRIINLSGYSQALRACGAQSGQMSEIMLESSSCQAPCNMMSCVYLWLSTSVNSPWMWMTMGEWLNTRHLWFITKVSCFVDKFYK